MDSETTKYEEQTPDVYPVGVSENGTGTKRRTYPKPQLFLTNPNGDGVVVMAPQGVTPDKYQDAVKELATACYQQGTPREVATAHVTIWAHSQPDPLATDAIEQIVNGVYQKHGTATVVKLKGIKPRQVQWLWPGRFPLGKLVGIEGDPGLGKTLLGIELAAQLSHGGTWHDGSPCAEGNTMLITYEDDINDAIVPRLLAAGADLDALRVLTQISDAKGNGHHAPSFPSDIPVIQVACREHDIKVLIIDPFAASLDDSVESWSDQRLRKALAPLRAMAERLQITVILIRHLNKKTGQDAQYRGGGSIAFMAACRAVYVIAPDPEQPDTLVMANQKLTIARKPSSLTFEIVEQPVRIEKKLVGIGKIHWLGESPLTAKQLLTPDKRKNTQQEQGKRFLLQEFKPGQEKPRDKVYAKAQQQGISEDALYRAATELRYDTYQKWVVTKHARKEEGKNVWYVKAPSEPLPPL
jgi:RecA-family ATPase